MIQFGVSTFVWVSPFSSAHFDLAEMGYDGAVVIETFGAPSEELAKAASIWRPLANSPDELAREGLDFYKSLFRR